MGERLMRPTVLLLTDSDVETTILESILSEQVNLHSVTTLAQFNERLRSGEYNGLFCAWFFADGTWTDCIDSVQSARPGMPVIVFRETAGEAQWAEVVKQGAMALLTAPYSKHEVVWALNSIIRRRAPAPNDGSSTEALPKAS
jgi:DNA-binding NtrC family response regulator